MTSATSLPHGWRWVRFGDVVRQVKQTTNDPESEGLTRIVGLDHLDSECLTLRRWNELAELPDGTSFTRVFHAGQVLFGKRRAYQRKVAVAHFDGVCSGDILVFEPSTDELLPDFLPYVVQSDGFFDHALGTSAGSLSPRTKWQELAKYEFALPPLDHQRETSELLGACMSLYSSYALAYSSAEVHRDAAIADLWSGCTDYEQLDTLADITVGIVVRPADLYVDVGGIPTLRSLNVAPNRLVEDELVYISAEAHTERTKSQLSGGEVIVVRSGRPGDAAVIPFDGTERHAVDLLIVRCGLRIRPHFLSAYLNSAAGRAQLIGRSGGTAQQHLNAGQLKQVSIPIIDAGAQDKVVAVAEESDQFLAQLSEASTNLATVERALREGLLAGTTADV